MPIINHTIRQIKNKYHCFPIFYIKNHQMYHINARCWFLCHVYNARLTKYKIKIIIRVHAVVGTFFSPLKY